MLTIHRATMADLPTVVDFLTQLSAAPYYLRPDTARIESGVRTVMTGLRHRSWYYLAYRAGRAVGQSRVQVLWEDLRAAPEWYLGRLFVAPTARRGGVATALIAHVRAEAEAAGVASLMCDIRSANDPCMRLQERLGLFRNSGSAYHADLLSTGNAEPALGLRELFTSAPSPAPVDSGRSAVSG